jgi:L,D-transpeptidase catalytic domain
MLRTTKSLVRGTAIGLLLASAPVQSLPAREPASIEARADDLKPGQYVWNASGAPEGPLEIVVSLDAQMAYVYRGGSLIGASTVSTGKEGHETPTGHFPILQKRKVHHSNRYDNAPMPYMQRLNWHGVALHGGQIPGYPASHGCVRLPMKFAQKLFGATSLGASVYIVGTAPASPELALDMARGSFAAGAP